ncbi:MAG: hypothetical protein JXA71_19775 [Chitinispirillaceae bacterium]|nr:hypothetical protein [Chitinispirillaceae bacterium]
MLTINRAKSLQGNYTLPSSPDLFLVAALVAAAAKSSARFPQVTRTPYLDRLAGYISPCAALSWEDRSCLLTPNDTDPDAPLFFDDDQLPYRDLVVFLALSTRRPVLFKHIAGERLAFWKNQAHRIGYTLEQAVHDGCSGLALSDEINAGATVPFIKEQDLHAALGLFWGLRARRSFSIDFTLSTPLRHLAAHFGNETTIKRELGETEKDPLVRRMKIQARQRLSSSEQLFTVNADFSTPLPDRIPEIVLPGDEILCGLLLLGKSLFSRGSFVVDNAPLEPWAMPILGLMRKMGCKPSLQESGQTPFGACGMVTFQKFAKTGQKTDCAPVFHLPAMALLAAFAEGESLFRNFDDLRLSDPDAIRQIESCLRTMQVKIGDIHDGFIIKGSQEYDGFDLIEPLPAHLCGAFAVAGLACVGSTTINDELLVERWPAFPDLLETYFEYRT